MKEFHVVGYKCHKSERRLEEMMYVYFNHRSEMHEQSFLFDTVQDNTV